MLLQVMLLRVGVLNIDSRRRGWPQVAAGALPRAQAGIVLRRLLQLAVSARPAHCTWEMGTLL